MYVCLFRQKWLSRSVKFKIGSCEDLGSANNFMFERLSAIEKNGGMLSYSYYLNGIIGYSLKIESLYKFKFTVNHAPNRIIRFS